MEYVDGPTLRQVLDKHPRGLADETVRAISQGLFEAMDFAHQSGVIHRDIKPCNILLDHPLQNVAHVQPQQVKVADFGLGLVGGLTTASLLNSGSLKTEDGGNISGTLVYMSPEQREGRELDGRSDIYSCGIVLFELLTGERPQGSELPSQVRSGVPRFLDEIFQRCYCRLEKRFTGAREVLESLKTGVTPAQAISVPPTARFTRPLPSDVCPRCGHQPHDEDQFCINCGAQLVDPVPRCPTCESFIDPTDQFCIRCGQELLVYSRTKGPA
jgi:serine/threonine-protein kinase